MILEPLGLVLGSGLDQGRWLGCKLQVKKGFELGLAMGQMLEFKGQNFLKWVDYEIFQLSPTYNIYWDKILFISKNRV